jgi:hypothetical protein
MPVCSVPSQEYERLTHLNPLGSSRGGFFVSGSGAPEADRTPAGPADRMEAPRSRSAAVAAPPALGSATTLLFPVDSALLVRVLCLQRYTRPKAPAVSPRELGLLVAYFTVK